MSAQSSVISTTSAASGRSTVSTLSLALAACAAISFGMVGAVPAVVTFAVPLLLAALMVRRPPRWSLLLAGIPAAVLVVWAATYAINHIQDMAFYDWFFVIGCGGVALALLAAVLRAATVRT
jgi:hypothetical protein